MAHIKCDRCGKEIEFGNQTECTFTHFENQPDGTVLTIVESLTVCKECYDAM